MFAWRDQYLSFNGPSKDPYWTSVSFLENFELPQDAFVDSSTNNFPITVNGDTKPSLQTPFTAGTGGSLYFDGNGDYLSTPVNSAFSFGTGDYTVECWIYLTSVTGYHCIFVSGTGVTVGNWAAYINGSTSFEIFNNGSGPAKFTQSISISVNTWYHIAVARSSSTTKLFIGGVLQGSGATDSFSYTSTTGNAQIGADGVAGGQYYWQGFISNLRVIKGTAQYTSNFTPSTTPLTAVSGTSLLVNATNQGLLNNTTYIDSATVVTTAAYTVTGTPRYSGLSPFGNNYPGSVYYTGGSYLQSNTNLTQSGDFTIELWVYHITPASFNGWIVIGNESANRISFAVLSTNVIVYNMYAQANVSFGTLTPNQWSHVALVRSGTTVQCYVNGTQSGTNKTLSGNVGNSAYYQTPHPTNMVGYLTNIRVSNTALYTSSFTPSTTPFTVTSNTKMLQLANGGYQDLSTKGQLITNTSTNNLITTQIKRFGTQSGSFTATGYQTVTNSTSLTFGTSDFTIEGWVYRNSAGATHSIICKGASTPTGWLLQINSSNQLVWTSDSTALKTSTTTIPATTWTYFAITRSGTTGYMFINGTLEGSSYTDSSNYNQTSNMNIGADRSNINGLSGYLDDLRITTGICRYTATFTAPTIPFPTS